jgi:hypothetical protein
MQLLKAEIGIDFPKQEQFKNSAPLRLCVEKRSASNN